MTLEDQIKDPMRRMLEFTGRDLIVVNQKVTGIDERYRDPSYEETETVVKGEIAQRGIPQFENMAGGVDSDIDSIIWVPDNVDVTTGQSSDDEGATVIRDPANDNEYVVYGKLDEGNGKYRLTGVEA